MEKILYQYHYEFLWLLPCFVTLIFGLCSFFFWKINLKMHPGCEFKGNPGFRSYNFARLFGRIGGTFCLLMFIFLTINQVYIFYHVKHLIDTNNVKVVEGYVEKYHPDSEYKGGNMENFTINGVYFEYSEGVISVGGYNNAASHGGVIRHNGQYLKIKYYKDRLDKNEIVYISQPSPTK
ncbi:MULTISPECIES: hypothetical protein [unclassified Bacillus (in: firmicutes)]|uniref:hypothetical protein n=1 Tax=unclassified Bacillus (in: firmicutes) TaxID=185979 RepID=UPI000BF158EB|nr:MULTISPECIES: hypothetical protein [unclassified Bacillus (in: firmicutes)]PEJ59233.1 hypothetical protein CN692_07070 [Bacillus sp. AFS002410]PEL07772.1 hypothetical protein CN601_18950 [Bacillus sp. AFS017336]